MSAPFDCELLESRTFLSAGPVPQLGPEVQVPFISVEARRTAPQLAPASLNGLTFTRVITKGTHSLPGKGTYKVVYSKTSEKFETSVGDYGGSYTYKVTGKNTATIASDNSVFGKLTVTLTFTSSTTGTFHIAGASGTQDGTFTV